MSEMFIFGAKGLEPINTATPSVTPNQIVFLDGYDNPRYVVYKIDRDKWGITYHLIDLETHRFSTAESIRPYSQKFGIGMYYNDAEPEYMEPAAVADLLVKANMVKAEEERKRREQEAENDRLREIGAARLRELLPTDAKAALVAYLEEDESDYYSDYHGSRTVRRVILGFSPHTRNLFPEMRRAAAHFSETAHLTDAGPKYEHRENYSMGGGYYLGANRYSGWKICKEPFTDPERFIERYALTAADEDNIHLTAPGGETDSGEVPEGVHVEIVDYSEKAIAIFGDTEPIKEILSSLYGRFNRRLTRGEEKCAGWIFPKTRAEKVREALAPYLTPATE